MGDEAEVGELGVEADEGGEERKGRGCEEGPAKGGWWVSEKEDGGERSRGEEEENEVERGKQEIGERGRAPQLRRRRIGHVCLYSIHAKIGFCCFEREMSFERLYSGGGI